MSEKHQDHAKQNAASHAETMCQLYRAYNALNSGEMESVEVDGEEYADADELTQRVMESALSVDVRSGWTPASDVPLQAEEFQILLSTGGPAMRIIGDINRGSADGAKMEFQDWGTPWTLFCGEDEDYDAALDWFVSCFYFGE